MKKKFDAAFCVEALDAALAGGCPAIFNSDQGSQFTSDAFTMRLKDSGAAISMDGRGRYLDNIFVERLWRSVKYEEVYLKDYADVWEAEREFSAYFRWYNEGRPHQSLNYATPAQVYFN
jgi:putative transposase